MLGYIVRRLFLMIPTLLGITFLVFMLLALAPGGIGAALRAAGGNVDADSKASLQLLYIEDRYGLDDHPVVQYGRWLARISPVGASAKKALVTPSRSGLESASCWLGNVPLALKALICCSGAVSQSARALASSPL